MKIKLAPTTLLAYQAAIAMILCFFVGDLFQLERPYWAVLTALLMISQTWGESIKKAIERVSMTILGGVVGTVIYFSISHHPTLMLLVMMSAVFCIVYCIGYSFRLTAFFVTFFVVFLFAMIARWDFEILEVRIYETFIGSSIAVITAFIFFPVYSKSKFQNLAIEYICHCKLLIDKSFQVAGRQEEAKVISHLRDSLFQIFRQITQAYQTSRYEQLFTLLPRRQAKILINEFAVLLHYITNLLESAAFIQYDQFDTQAKNQLLSIKTTLIGNLEHIIGLMENTSQPCQLAAIHTELEHVTENIIANLETKEMQPTSRMQSLSFMYYLEKINEILLRMQTQLQQLTKP